MCRCNEKYDFLRAKVLAQKSANLEKIDYVVYKNPDNSYNFASYEFAVFNNKNIIGIIKYK